ncbi:MAG: bifunctional riboflavin kinase/FAD synthetase [Alphaproteobacteria bacterium]
MRIFRHFTELPGSARGGVIALGNFDGVHRGHQAVIGTARRLARQQGVGCGVMTFEPHPRAVFAPHTEPFRLTPFRIKARCIEALGVDILIAQHFDQEFSSHTADQFIQRVLVQSLGVRHVVVGYDYVFGSRRGGNVALLKQAGNALGFGVTSLDPVTSAEGVLYSSTEVRACLIDGRPHDAAGLLGRYWEVEGRVERGDQRGRQLGFPTANLLLGEYQRPALGVYAVRAGIDRGPETVWHNGIANFGRRPSFDDRDPLLEVHLLDHSGDLYHQHLRVALVSFVRPERVFDGREALITQITEDIRTVRTVLAPHRFSDRPGPIVSAETAVTDLPPP